MDMQQMMQQLLGKMETNNEDFLSRMEAKIDAMTDANQARNEIHTLYIQV
jgi:hypothetical protein